MADTRVEREAFGEFFAVLSAGVATFIGLVLALKSNDSAMALHGIVFAIVGAIGGFAVLTHRSGNRQATLADEYHDGPIKFAVVTAIVWGIAGFLVGDILAWQMAFPVSTSISHISAFGASARCTRPRSYSRSAATCFSRRRSTSFSALATRALPDAGRRGS